MNDHEHIHRVVRSFRKINKAIYQQLREEADQLDMTAIQILVLRVLSKKPNSSLGEVAEQIQVGSSTMSGIVERLVKADLVIRERSQTDRRTLTMRLTAIGEEKQKEAFSKVMSRLSGKLQGISDHDLKTLLALHDQILERIG